MPAGATPFDEQGWALFSGAPDHPGNRAAIIDFTTGNKLTKTFINRVVQHSLDNSTVEAFAAYLQAWAKSDFTAEAKVDTATPVKLIVGVNDPALSADVMEQTWRVFFPDAELTILPDAGHYPMFESPVSLATSIEEFLGRMTGRRPGRTPSSSSTRPPTPRACRSTPWPGCAAPPRSPGWPRSRCWAGRKAPGSGSCSGTPTSNRC